MKTIALLLISIFTVSPLSAQFQSQIIEKSSGKPVPYVNIWLESEKRGTTSDVRGNFSFEEADSSKAIIISAIGYEVRKIVIGNLPDTVQLIPITTLLEEVAVFPMQGTTIKKVNDFKRSDGRVLFFYPKCTWHTWEDLQLIARKIPFKKEYEATPYLKKISILTSSKVKEASFRLRLYTVNDTGGPGDYLLYEPIKANAKQGFHKTTVELSQYNLRMPAEGMFVVIEHLGIPENMYQMEYEDGKKVTCFAPEVHSVEQDQNGTVYNFYRGKWYARQTEYCLPAMELVLSD